MSITDVVVVVMMILPGSSVVTLISNVETVLRHMTICRYTDFIRNH